MLIGNTTKSSRTEHSIGYFLYQITPWVPVSACVGPDVLLLQWEVQPYTRSSCQQIKVFCNNLNHLVLTMQEIPL